jgi:hypothetical protein
MAVKIPVADRRRELEACAVAVARLARNPAIVAVHVTEVGTDNEIRRTLEAIVRRWGRWTPVAYESPAAAAGTATCVVDHVVPCRVLVDRLIMHPDECAVLLQEAVVLARITKAEHQALGGIYAHHSGIYEKMLAAKVSRLPSLGLRRYKRTGIELLPANVPANGVL